MAEYGKSLKNGRVVVRNQETGEILADTRVLEYDDLTRIITIPRGNIPEDAPPLTVLILSQNTVFEYNGKARKTLRKNELRIFIYGEKKKESRSYPRYQMQADATIDAFVIEGQRVPLGRPIPIQIENISANGLLILTGEYELQLGEQVWINIQLVGNTFTSIYEIIRCHEEVSTDRAYGCSILVQDDVQARQAQEFGSQLTDSELQPVLTPREVAMRYEDRQGQLELESGYAQLLKAVNQWLYSQQETVQQKLVEIILEMVKSQKILLLLNCIHRKRPELQERQRRCLNVAFLCGYLGLLQNYEETALHGCIQKGLYSGLEGKRGEDNMFRNVLTAAETYDTRGAHPTKAIAGIPLVYLEQLQYAGRNQPRGSVRRIMMELAKHILQSLYHQKVMLADGRIAEIVRILPNDVAHPLLLVDGVVKQEKDPWNLMWIQV